MPEMWFASDGRRPDTQRGPSVPISYEEIKGAFKEYRPEYVSNEPPQFNVESPSQYPVRVVIEVGEKEATNAAFPKVGFYLIAGLSPEKAQQLLSAYRNRG